MVPLYYDHLAYQYNDNLTRLRMLSELSSELSIRDQTNYQLIAHMHALQRQNDLLRIEREAAGSRRNISWDGESSDIKERLKESRRKRKRREEECTAMERAVDVLVNESKVNRQSRYNNHMATVATPYIHPLSQSTYTIRNLNNQNSHTSLHHGIDYKPNININAGNSRRKEMKRVKTYESSGTNTNLDFQPQRRQEGIVRNVATAMEKRSSSPRGISLTRERSPQVGMIRSPIEGYVGSPVSIVRERSPPTRVIVRQEPVMVRSAYPTNLPKTHHSQGPVRLEQVQMSRSSYIDPAVRVDSQPMDMKSQLFNRLRKSSMRGNKKSFLSVVSQSSVSKQR